MTRSEEISWRRLVQQAEGLLGVTTDRISNAANLSALLFQELPDVSWAGFYLLHGDTLLLGPFQGKPACVSIELGKGVCGAAAATGKIIRVDDVDTFEGHIACDSDARSEIVLPLIKNGVLLGVLDLDSTKYGRFGDSDEKGLAELAEVYLRSVT